MVIVSRLAIVSESLFRQDSFQHNNIRTACKLSLWAETINLLFKLSK